MACRVIQCNVGNLGRRAIIAIVRNPEYADLPLITSADFVQ